jgi:hypothetical protein
MNANVSPAEGVRPSPASEPRLRLAELREDLLRLHEDLLVQLRTEVACSGGSGSISSSRKLIAMIAQHKRAAAALRKQLGLSGSAVARASPAAPESKFTVG